MASVDMRQSESEDHEDEKGMKQMKNAYKQVFLKT